MTISSIEQCYQLADKLSDEGNQEAADAIGYCAFTARLRSDALKKLAWACKEKSSAKRSNALQMVLMELEAQGESLASFPMRERTA